MTTASAQNTDVVARPRFEGSNICTWIGFKHVMYLVEEAVLEHLRRQGLAPGRLYEEHGLGAEIVYSDARILTALHIDDQVRTRVVQQPPDGTRELTFTTTSLVQSPEPDGEDTKAVSATVRLLFRRDDDGTTPAEIAPFTVARIERGHMGRAVAEVHGRGATGAMPDPPGCEATSMVWRWRIPYFYCHYSRRLQHSGYLRLMEEAVDLFLAARGISIRTMVDDRGWIPVVPRAKVEILREALMEETLVTVFTVTDVFKNLTYDARMDWYVQRGDEYVHTATGRITHGYALIRNRRDWSLAAFDDRTIAALRGAAAS
jgi:acyl-CoA thioesterase FadM